MSLLDLYAFGKGVFFANVILSRQGGTNMKRKGFRKGIWLSIVLIFGLGIAVPTISGSEAVAAPAPEKARLTMGGSNQGTWIYMFSAIMADLWKRNIPGLDITVMATAGSSSNYAPLDKGEMDIAAGATSACYWARNGMYFTKVKLTNFRSLMPAGKPFNHIFTYADSPIKTLKDLDGKRVHLGARASPTSMVCEELFKILGIKPNYVYSTPAEAVDMVKDRRVDAMAYGVSAPWSAIMDIATTQPIKLIPMTPEDQKKIVEASPYQVADTIPAKTYSFQNEDYHTTLQGYQCINVKSGLSDELAYRMAKVAWEQWDEVLKATAAAKWVTAKDIVNMVAPIHPGAAKYYKEIGIQIPNRLIVK
jgi:TRAP transporter TAXI family solute receptor